jgi:hypothetical protein
MVQEARARILRQRRHAGRIRFDGERTTYGIVVRAVENVDGGYGSMTVRPQSGNTIVVDNT